MELVARAGPSGGDEHVLASLSQALTSFAVPETLDEANSYRCPTCAKLVRARKQVTVRLTPASLIIHLKRFGQGARRGSKLSHHVAFDETLDLSHVLSPSAIAEGMPTLYTLTGVLVHIGSSAHSGHYIAYVRTPSQWYCTSDKNVTCVSWDIVAAQPAYMLFYTRAPDQPPPTSGPGAIVFDALNGSVAEAPGSEELGAHVAAAAAASSEAVEGGDDDSSEASVGFARPMTLLQARNACTAAGLSKKGAVKKLVVRLRKNAEKKEGGGKRRKT